MNKLNTLFLLTFISFLLACCNTKFQSNEHSKPLQSKNSSNPAVNMNLDYGGIEAMIDALEKDSLTDADVDGLLRVHGVQSMVNNVTNYLPEYGLDEFRDEVKTFAKTKKSGKSGLYFQLHYIWQTRTHVRSLIASIKKSEKEIIRSTLDQLQRYSPKIDRLTVNVYFIGGGVSDGIVFDNSKEPAFYINLSTTDGSFSDYNDVVANMAHEAYHVFQKVALNGAGMEAVAYQHDKLKTVERLIAVTLAEGTANYVVDPTISNAAGEMMEKSRQRYLRNAQRERMQENFALFDSVLQEVRVNKIAWNDLYQIGFSGNNDARFYFVGYQIAKVIDKYCGFKCIGKLFEKQPVEFFRQYITLYRKHPEITGRFSKSTEEFLLQY
jgi:hypothetical protein